MTDADREKLREALRAKRKEDEEILREVRADINLLTEVKYRILQKKLHRQLMDLANEAVDNGNVQINSVEDFITLLELDLMLR